MFYLQERLSRLGDVRNKSTLNLLLQVHENVVRLLEFGGVNHILKFLFEIGQRKRKNQLSLGSKQHSRQ